VDGVTNTVHPLGSGATCLLASASAPAPAASGGASAPRHVCRNASARQGRNAEGVRDPRRACFCSRARCTGAATRHPDDRRRAEAQRARRAGQQPPCRCSIQFGFNLASGELCNQCAGKTLVGPIGSSSKPECRTLVLPAVPSPAGNFFLPSILVAHRDVAAAERRAGMVPPPPPPGPSSLSFVKILWLLYKRELSNPSICKCVRRPGRVSHL
jgi:hypothetical protein